MFCPENDIALGRNCTRFTPPRQAVLLARYGAPIMWWLGDCSDYVLIPPLVDEEYVERLLQWERVVKARYGSGPCLVTSLDGIEADTVCPWGWSGYTAQLFKRAGADENLIERCAPDFVRVRDLSHRRSATVINRFLADMVDWERFGHPVPEGAYEAKSIEEVKVYLSGHNTLYAKSPWSSSGRGVICSRDIDTGRMLARCESVIRDQGSVMLEPAYEGKVVDFAMLFECRHDGTVCLHGYSMFFNARSTAYAGNIVSSDREILHILSGYVGESLLCEVKHAIETILTQLIGGSYNGFLGVDMMIVRGDGGRFRLVPCVELNLRMTMGIVAHAVYERCGISGIMKVISGIAGDSTAGEIGLVPSNEFFTIKIGR